MPKRKPRKKPIKKAKKQRIEVAFTTDSDTYIGVVNEFSKKKLEEHFRYDGSDVHWHSFNLKTGMASAKHTMCPGAKGSRSEKVTIERVKRPKPKLVKPSKTWDLWYFDEHFKAVQLAPKIILVMAQTEDGWMTVCDPFKSVKEIEPYLLKNWNIDIRPMRFQE